MAKRISKDKDSVCHDLRSACLHISCKNSPKRYIGSGESGICCNLEILNTTATNCHLGTQMNVCTESVLMKPRIVSFAFLDQLPVLKVSIRIIARYRTLSLISCRCGSSLPVALNR